MKNNQNNILPKGWIWTKLGDISSLEAGNPAPQGKEYFENGVFPFVRVQDMGRIGNNIYLHDTKDHLNNKAVQKNMKLFPSGAILFTKSGMSILLNQRAILARDMYVVSHIGIAFPLGEIPSQLLYYWLKTIDFKTMTHATTLPSLQLSKVNEMSFPLPPLPEENRIVTKIEELFTKLDAGVEALKKIKAELKRYRQSVLKSAFEGKLTEEWRAIHKRELEPASVLLERIKEERKKKLGKKYKELPPVDIPDLPKLPVGWVWTKLGEVILEGQIGLVKSNHEQNKEKKGIIYIKMNNVTMDGKVLLDDFVYVDVSEQDRQRYSIRVGDILFNTRNSIELVGKTGLVRGQVQGMVYNNNLMRIRTSNEISPAFTVYQMCSMNFRSRMEIVKRATTNVAAIYAKDLILLPFIFPPFIEQEKVVQEIERRFSVADAIENTVEQSLKQADRLRQSILKRAFEGKLVPQDPNDELAEKLLERIKVEKEKQLSERNNKKSKEQ